MTPLRSHNNQPHPDLTGWAPGEAEAFSEGWLRAAELWGSSESLRAWDPAIVSTRTLQQMGLLERTGVSPAGARGYTEAALRIDVSGMVSASVASRTTPSHSIPSTRGNFTARPGRRPA